MFTRSRAARLGAAAITLTALVALAGCTTPADEEDTSTADAIANMDPIELIVGEPLPPTSSANYGTNLFMEYVTEATDGKVTFDVYDSSTLHPMQEALSAMESGLSDITLYIPGLLGNDVPSGAWGSGLAAFTTGTPFDMMAGSVAASAAFMTSEAITEELAAHNAVLLGAWASDSYSLLCTEPVQSLADAEGILARTSGGVYTAEAEALGMVPVLMDANEVYEGLQRGSLNCQIGALQTFVNDGLAEVAKYYTVLPFSPNTGAGYIMAKDKWDALIPEVQQIFREAGPLIGGLGNNRRVLERYEEWFTTAGDDFDVEFITPDDDLAEALADFRAAQGATLADRAPENVEDPQATIDLFKRVYAEWIDILADEFGLEPTDGSEEANIAQYEYLGSEFDWDGYRARWAAYIADLS